MEALVAVEEEERLSAGTTSERVLEPELDEMGRTSRLTAGSQEELMLAVLGLVKALHAMTVVPLLLRLVESEGGAVTLGSTLEKAALQHPSALRNEICETCLIILGRIEDKVDDALAIGEVMTGLANYCKAVGKPTPQVRTAYNMLLTHFDEGRAEAAGIEGFSEVIDELRGFAALAPVIEEVKAEEVSERLQVQSLA
jgi:hypothetical protein